MVESLKHFDVVVFVGCAGGRVSVGGGDVGRGIVEGVVRGIETHPDDPRISALGGDEGDCFIDLDGSCVGAAVGARDEGGDVGAGVSGDAVLDFDACPCGVVGDTSTLSA